MFAFSQIIASGNKVSQVTDAMDKENEQRPESKDEDNALLEFSYTMPGNDGEEVKQPVDLKKLEEEQKAQKELEKLNTDESTAALVGLAQAEELEQKMEKQVIENTGGASQESASIEEDFKKASGQLTKPKIAAPKPKKLAQTQTSPVKAVAGPVDDGTVPDKDTLLSFSTDVAQAAGDIDDSQNIQLPEEKPLIAAQTHSMSSAMLK